MNELEILNFGYKSREQNLSPEETMNKFLQLNLTEEQRRIKTR